MKIKHIIRIELVATTDKPTKEEFIKQIKQDLELLEVHQNADEHLQISIKRLSIIETLAEYQ